MQRLAEPAARRVLVVEDHPDCLATMLALLSIEGCEARGAANGEEALAAAEDWRPDMILMDIGLPLMDGCEVAARIRDLGGTPRPTIAVITGWDIDEIRERADACGIDLILAKPISWQQLTSLISQVSLSTASQPLNPVGREWPDVSGGPD